MDGAADVRQNARVRGRARNNIEIEREVAVMWAMTAEVFYWVSCSLCIFGMLYTPFSGLVPWKRPVLLSMLCLIFITRHSEPPSQFYFDNIAGRLFGLRADITTGAYPSDGWRRGCSFFRRVLYMLVVAVYCSVVFWWHPYGSRGPPWAVRTRQVPKVLATSVVGTVSLFTIDHFFFQTAAVTGIRDRAQRRA